MAPENLQAFREGFAGWENLQAFRRGFAGWETLKCFEIPPQRLKGTKEHEGRKKLRLRVHFGKCHGEFTEPLNAAPQPSREPRNYYHRATRSARKPQRQRVARMVGHLFRLHKRSYWI